MTSAFEEQNAASTLALLCLEQRWADEPNTELLRKDRHVNVTPQGKQSQYFFDAARRRSHDNAEWRIGGVAPGMRNILGETDCCAGRGIKCFVAARDTCRAFHDQKVPSSSF
jgi:hypothetical protein